jgi:hypothetical protein
MRGAPKHRCPLSHVGEHPKRNGRPFDRPLVLCRLGEPLFSDLFAAKVRFLFQHTIDRAHVDDIGGGNLMLVLAAETPQPDIDSFFKRKHRLRQGKLREAGARRDDLQIAVDLRNFQSY